VNKFITLALTGLSFIFSSSVLAEGFNDNYLQVGYSTNDYKHSDKITHVSGSAELGDNYLISGSYDYETGDWSDPGEYETQTAKKMSIGIEGYFPVSSSTDISSSIGLENWDITSTTKVLATSVTTNKAPFEGKFTHIGIGFRNLTSNNVEISFKNTWTKYKNPTVYYYYKPSIKIRHISANGIESSIDYSKTNEILNLRQSRLELRLIKHINESFSIGGRLSIVKDPKWTETGIFVRRSF
tara:strand:+ start:82 stop:804 length:723 start_codon:yes stop_codon:yes gene_type:complete